MNPHQKHSADRGLRRRAIVTIVCVVACGAVLAAPFTANSARADSCCEEKLCCGPVCDCKLRCDCTPRDIDEVWLISTRCLGCPYNNNGAEPALSVKRYVDGAGWTDSSASEFLAESAPPGDGSIAPITTFFVHGNRRESGEATREGWNVYHKLATDQAPPLRFVIFSWPSDQIRGQLRDVRAKAVRSDTDAYYLGWLLSRMDPHAPVSLIGFSYGARIITGGLHVAAGGRSAGASLGDLPATTVERRARVVLLAAAVHRWWLYPGERHELAMPLIDSLLVLYNSCDPALKRYHAVEKCYDPVALGYTGFANCAKFGEAAQRVRQADVCCTVGATHDLRPYLCSECLMERMRREVLWQPSE